MAVMKKILLASAALVALTNAAPFNARSAVTDMVTETAWTTVDVDITVWVDENGKPYSTETGAPYAPAAATPPSASSATTSTEAAASPSTTTTTTTTTTPAAGSFYQSPAPTTTTAAAPIATTPAAQYQPPTTSQAPAPSSAAAPAQQSSSSAAPAQQSSSPASYGAGSTSGTCEGSGNICSGDITHYDGGLGACGFNINTASDVVIALPYGFMGTASNNNPYCGRKVMIVNPDTGATVQATVGDKCMGCEGRSIDLTDAAFAAVAPNCDGRCSGFKWYFAS